MKAKQIDTETHPHHSCNYHETLHEGYIDSFTGKDVEVLYREARNLQDGWDYATDEEIEEASDVTIYVCGEGWRTIGSYEIQMCEEVWRCGGCGAKYPDANEAGQCCR